MLGMLNGVAGSLQSAHAAANAAAYKAHTAKMVYEEWQRQTAPEWNAPYKNESVELLACTAAGLALGVAFVAVFLWWAYEPGNFATMGGF